MTAQRSTPQLNLELAALAGGCLELPDAEEPEDEFADTPGLALSETCANCGETDTAMVMGMCTTCYTQEYGG